MKNKKEQIDVYFKVNKITQKYLSSFTVRSWI